MVSPRQLAIMSGFTYYSHQPVIINVSVVPSLCKIR